MANVLKRVTGQATIAGTPIYIVPSGSVVTIIGFRGANTDASANHWITFEINGTLVSGVETPLPAGNAIDIMVGAKLVAEAGDVITALSDTNSDIDVYISYLEQT